MSKGLIADTQDVKRARQSERQRVDALVAAITAKERGECVCQAKQEHGFEYLKCEAHDDK